jgi:hypothetical protein
MSTSTDFGETLVTARAYRRRDLRRRPAALPRPSRLYCIDEWRENG